MRIVLAIIILIAPDIYAQAQFPKENLNIIIFTADDLGSDGTGIGAFGAKINDITPNIDKVALAGARFSNAHVNTAICAPSRGIIATGQYAFNSLHHGFFYAPDSIPTLMESFQKKGYKIGILGKVDHSSVKITTQWDYVYDFGDLGSGRSPEKFYEKTKAFIGKCQKEVKPFYLMINSSDPHRPFQKSNGNLLPGAEWPSKLYTAEEAFIPPFLPELPAVKAEMSEYYNSVRRLDDTFGKVMQAIKEAGIEDKTVVIFLSDNGMAMPFAKANSYLQSTKTPFFIYSPEFIKPIQDQENMISTVDLFPTIMEMIGAEVPAKIDGRSFLPLIEGKSQDNREMVFTQIDYLYSNKYYPMRCVLDKSFGYIFNPWSDGRKEYHNNNEGITFTTMIEHGQYDPELQERVKMFRYREMEEFYDLKKDPGCTSNLIDDPEYSGLIKQYKEELRKWMEQYNDPVLQAFDLLHQPIKMRKALDEIYNNQLQSRPREYDLYMQKVESMNE